MVEVAVYDDNSLAGKNFKTHDVKYIVVIVSQNPALNLESAKAKFSQQRPAAKVALVAPALLPKSAPSNAIVLLQSISFSYAAEMERDAFISGIEKLWHQALGTMTAISLHEKIGICLTVSYFWLHICCLWGLGLPWLLHNDEFRRNSSWSKCWLFYGMSRMKFLTFLS